MMRRILLLTLTIFFLLPCRGRDDYRYRSITMNEGLPSNAVRNIVQDPQGFVWFGTDNGLCRYDGTRVSQYRIPELGLNQYVSALTAGAGSLFIGTEKGVFALRHQYQSCQRLPLEIHTTVTYISFDKDSTLWVSTNGQGVWQYLPSNGTTKHYPFAEIGGTVSQVFIDNDNQVWAVANVGGHSVWRLNRLHGSFEPVNFSFPTDYSALRMLQTSDGQLWLGSWEQGLLMIHGDGQLERVLPEVGLHIHTLLELADGRLCIGCDDGAIVFDRKTRQYEMYSQRFVYSVMNDREGGIWVGTFYNGVYYVTPSGRRFASYSMSRGTEWLRGNVISRFCEDRQGRVWIASDDGGLMCFSQPDYNGCEQLKHLNVHALEMEGDNLWIGTYTDGIYVMNTMTGALCHFMPQNEHDGLMGSSSYAIYASTGRGSVWVATMEGLCRFDLKEGRFHRVKEISAVTIDIDEDHKGRLWLSTQGAGLWLYNPQTDTWKEYRHRHNDATTLPDDEVNCCLVDESGQLWAGSRSGLCRYIAEKDAFERIRLDIPSQNVMAIVEDHGALWLTTDRGIVKYQPKLGLQLFTRHDGLVSEQFQPNAALKTSDEHIFVGTTNGFNTFYPYQIKANPAMAPVFITSMSTYNQEERTADGLPLDLSLIQEIVLSYSDARMFSLDFASLSYCSPEKNQYAYMLEGFDRDWNYVGNQNRASYTNIPSGTYTFRVKATNNDGVWSTNEATLKIVVHPPFWWSWYAKLFYLLLIGAIIWQYVHYRLKQAEHQHQREMQRLNEEKEKEVREARLNFFTMIAHEIRTPVSLIIGPLEKMMKRGTPTDDLRVIDRNAHRLLELVNQLLDFRKVEQQMLVMHFAPQNIHELIQNVSVRFAPTFEQGGKRFTVIYPDEHFTAIIDKEAITKVVSNLLTNANKYTKDEVRLTCMAEPDGEHFRIEVADNGVGIREEDRQHIFDAFFQAQDNKPGTGIGLNIVKNIVDQHHGEISVISEIGQGSTFTVVLPVKQEAEAVEETLSHPESEHKSRISPPESGEKGTDRRVELGNEAEGRLQGKNLGGKYKGSTLPKLLIVDDSEDMVDFLSNNFQEKYEVITASDGIEALALLQKHEVSIIISDWMMPRMDGAEFCHRVRRDASTSHIPFVMLTAKTDDDSKVEGMDVGADIYIEKPFSVEYLEACIRNMLKRRRELMEKFSTQPLEPVTEIAQNPTDNEFLQKMNRLIEENFANSELNVNFLAEQLNISRSGLFAKIKTLADVTPNEMIQIVRLKKAAQLLKEGQHQISEICYMVGFSNPSYFSKCFYKQFGIKPGDFASKQP